MPFGVLGYHVFFYLPKMTTRLHFEYLQGMTFKPLCNHGFVNLRKRNLAAGNFIFLPSRKFSLNLLLGIVIVNPVHGEILAELMFMFTFNTLICVNSPLQSLPLGKGMLTPSKTGNAELFLVYWIGLSYLFSGIASFM